MSMDWQKLRVPILERLALADIAMRRGETEEAALARILREEARRECIRLTRQKAQTSSRRPREEQKL